MWIFMHPLKKVGFKIHVQKCANTFVDATQSSASEILLNGADVCLFFFFFQNNEQSWHSLFKEKVHFQMDSCEVMVGIKPSAKKTYSQLFYLNYKYF